MSVTQVVISYLNNNANAVIAIASVVTAFATIVIALFTYVSSRMLKWEKEKDRRNRQPILVIIEEITGDHKSLYIKNIGYGPAVNIVRNIIQTGKITKHISTNEPLPVQPLGQGDKSYAYCATQAGTCSVPMLDDSEFHVLIEYDDIFNNHYETSFKNRRLSTARIIQRKIPVDQAAKI